MGTVKAGLTPVHNAQYNVAVNSRPFGIATAQSLIGSDIRANGRHVRDLMRQAAQSGARLVHFPEGALSGYVKSEILDWRDCDWTALQEEQEAVASLAGKLRLWVVVGSAHRLTAPNRPHNSLHIISDGGALVDRYDKRLCSHTEISDWFTPGSTPVTFVVDGITFGCALCIELCFPDLFAEYERLGVDCLLVSAYSRDAIHGVMAHSHAATFCTWLSLAVPAQCSGTLPSAFIGPHGRDLAGGVATGRPELLAGVIDQHAPELAVPLAKARPWRALARQGDIYAARRVHDVRSDDRRRF